MNATTNNRLRNYFPRLFSSYLTAYLEHVTVPLVSIAGGSSERISLCQIGNVRRKLARVIDLATEATEIDILPTRSGALTGFVPFSKAHGRRTFLEIIEIVDRCN